MNPGDRVSITERDTDHGLRIDVSDRTTQQIAGVACDTPAE